MQNAFRSCCYDVEGSDKMAIEVGEARNHCNSFTDEGKGQF